LDNFGGTGFSAFGLAWASAGLAAPNVVPAIKTSAKAVAIFFI
jgi:hypothetical protein